MKNCMNCGNGPWRDGKEECRWCSWSYKDFSGDPTRWKPKDEKMKHKTGLGFCLHCGYEPMKEEFSGLYEITCPNCGNFKITKRHLRPKEDDMCNGTGTGGPVGDRYWATDRRKDFTTPCNQDCCDPGGAKTTEPTGGVYFEKPPEDYFNEEAVENWELQKHDMMADEHWERLSGLFTAMDLSKSQMVAGLWYLYKHGRDKND
jgi:predicted RNA-binding Zn-ribbon protein involved in translation (DUF1610 family)